MKRASYPSDLSNEQWKRIKQLVPAVVHPADIQDRDGAKLVLALIKHTILRLRLIWADGGYAGQLLNWVRSLLAMIGFMVRRLAQE